MDRYVIHGGREGAQRLEILARSSAAVTAGFWERIGVVAGANCLDIGCGPGFLSLELARRVGPTGRVVGVDSDAEAVALATERRDSAELTNVEFVVGDVYDVALPGGVDLAYTRFLLQHLSRPAEVLGAMWDALRPGGVLAVEDADFEGGFCHPESAGFDFWMRNYPRLLRQRGGNPASGRMLVSTFLEAGLPAPHVDVSQRVDREGDAKGLPLMTVEATAAEMIAAGVATSGEVDAAVEEMRAFVADPTTIVGGPRHFQAWVVKPVEAGGHG